MYDIITLKILIKKSMENGGVFVNYIGLLIPFLFSGMITYLIFSHIDKKLMLSTKISDWLLKRAGKNADKVSMSLIFLIIGIPYLAKLAFDFNIIFLGIICGAILGLYTVINPKIVAKANSLKR